MYSKSTEKVNLYLTEICWQSSISQAPLKCHLSLSTVVINLRRLPKLDFCYGYLGLFQYFYEIESSSLTRISLIKSKMSNCLHSLVGTIAELLERMLWRMCPLGTSDEEKLLSYPRANVTLLKQKVGCTLMPI